MSLVPTKNIPRLVNLCCYGYNRALPGGDWVPTADKTFCNEFVNYVCTGFGYVELAGLLANEIFDFLANPANGWIIVDGVVGQSHANDGVIVIAAWKNPVVGAHGHVAIIFPGLLDASGSYGRQVPKIVNVGKDVFIGKKLSFGFTPEEQPTIFAFGAMIA